MKNSGIPWIGQIPEHWEVTNLKQLLKFQKGSIPKAFSDTKLDTPYLTMDYLRGNEGSLTLYPIPDASLVTMNESDLIVLWDGANAGEFIVSKYGFLGSTMAKVIFDFNFFETKYLYYLLKALEPISKDFANGTTIPHFTPKFLYSYCYPIAPHSEQEAIAAYLDKKCGEIDELIEVEQQMISDLESYRQSVITEAVTHGLNPNAEFKKSDVYWIGDIPKQWSIAKMKFFIQISNGSDPKTEGDIPVYGSGAASFKTCGEFKEGPTVLIGRKGATLHIPHYIEGKYWNVDTAFDTSVNNYNLRYFFYIASILDYKAYISSTTLPSMTQSNYENMSIPVPPLSEQQEIADYLDAKCAEIDELIKVKQGKIETLKQYRQSLIFEAVTGKTTIA